MSGHPKWSYLQQMQSLSSVGQWLTLQHQTKLIAFSWPLYKWRDVIIKQNSADHQMYEKQQKEQLLLSFKDPSCKLAATTEGEAPLGLAVTAQFGTTNWKSAPGFKLLLPRTAGKINKFQKTVRRGLSTYLFGYGANQILQACHFTFSSSGWHWARGRVLWSL